MHHVLKHALPAVVAATYFTTAGATPPAEQGELGLTRPVERVTAASRGEADRSRAILGWRQATRLPWADAFEIEGTGRVLVANITRHNEENVRLELEADVSTVWVPDGLPPEVPPEAYARLAASNAERVARARKMLPDSPAFKNIRDFTGKPVLLDPDGELAEVTSVTVHVLSHPSVDGKPRIVVDSQIGFTVAVGESYRAGTFGHGIVGVPEVSELWVWTTPGADGAGNGGAPGNEADGRPVDAEDGPRWVKVRDARGGTLHLPF